MQEININIIGFILPNRDIFKEMVKIKVRKKAAVTERSTNGNEMGLCKGKSSALESPL